MIFDITSEHTSKKFLSDFLDIDINVIDECIKDAKDNIFLDEFLESIDRTLEERDIDNLFAAAIHITTNDDDCESIRGIGLVNLKHTLSMDTPLSRYLKSYDISFYIYNNLMCIKERFHDITFDSLRNETDSITGKINQVARKIYSDYQIDAFFCLRESRSYDEDVNLRPQIISDLSKLGKNPYGFESKWIESSKSYIVKFIQPIRSFAFYSFYNNLDAFKEDHSKKLELKRWLVLQSLTVIWEHYHYGKLPKEIMAHLKAEVLVPAKCISEIRTI